MSKKLYKSKDDKKLCGVCGGLAEYFNVDPTIVRLIWAVLIVIYGSGILLYILCAIILPDKPANGQGGDASNQNADDANNNPG